MSTEQVALIPRCAECGERWLPGDEEHWRAYHDTDDELWYLARVMGTSTVQIEDTYARWLKRTDDRLRAAFDAYDERSVAAR